jgi:hypothetical protein
MGHFSCWLLVVSNWLLVASNKDDDAGILVKIVGMRKDIIPEFNNQLQHK